MMVTTAFPDKLQISMVDLFAVLFNLIDNAVGEVEGMTDSKVEIRVSKMKSNVMVEVNNPVKYVILLDNPHLQTTKKDRRKHGL